MKLDRLPILKRKIFSEEFYHEKRVIDALSYVKETYSFDINPILAHANQAYGIELTNEMIEKAKRDYKEIVEKDLMIDPEAVSRREIELFIMKHQNVHIYGNGVMAGIVYSNFFFYEENPDLKGFIVSDDQSISKESFKGYPVFHYSEVKDRPDIAFIVALNKRNTREVRSLLSKEKNVMFLWRC